MRNIPMKHPARIGRWALCLGACLLLIACAKPPPPPPKIVIPPPPEPPKPSVVQGRVLTSSDVNPEPGGRASPIVVRVYELKSTANFEKSDFFALYDKDEQTLGPELVAKQQFEMSPDAEREFEKDLPAGTRFLGVVAAYRNIQRAGWRQSIEIPEHKLTSVIIRVDRDRVSMSKTVKRDEPKPVEKKSNE
jgi:type VI secretion system protein VasD